MSGQIAEPGMMLREGITMEGKPWTVDVDVYLEDVSDPQNPVFHLETCLPFAQKNVDPAQTITFHNRGRDGFQINFNLIDQTKTEPPFTFPPQSKKNEALRSKKGEGCPTQDGQWEEFTVIRVVEPHQNTLVVRNANRTTTLFGYTLRVTNNGGDTYVNLDPGGDNQNGNFMVSGPGTGDNS